MSRTLTTGQFQQINDMDSTNPYIWLLYIEFNNSFIRLNSGNDTVTYDSNDYLPFPFSVSDHTEDSSGNINPFTVNVSIVSNDFKTWVNRRRGLQGQSVTISKYVNGSVLYSVPTTIQGASSTEQAISFELGFEDLINARFPGRRVARNGCQHEYGDRNNSLCGFPLNESWSPAGCDKTLWGANGCIAHGIVAAANAHPNPEKWPGNNGVFPGIPKQRF